MAEPFIAEIRVWACNFAPRQWAFCDGQILAISQNTALFALIGTYFGGNGTSTFALPNMQGRVAVDVGTGPGLDTYVIGEMGGQSTHTLLTSEMPAHSHTVSGATPGAAQEQTNIPSNQAWFGPSTGGGFTYASTTPSTSLSQAAIATSGGSVPHNNMQPYLTMNFCIAVEGIFPARN